MRPTSKPLLGRYREHHYFRAILKSINTLDRIIFKKNQVTTLLRRIFLLPPPQ